MPTAASCQRCREPLFLEYVPTQARHLAWSNRSYPGSFLCPSNGCAYPITAMTQMARMGNARDSSGQKLRSSSDQRKLGRAPNQAVAEEEEEEVVGGLSP